MPRLSAQQRAGLVVYKMMTEKRSFRPMEIARMTGLKLRGSLELLYKLQRAGVIVRERDNSWRAKRHDNS